MRRGLRHGLALALIGFAGLFSGVVLASCGGDEASAPTTDAETTTETTTTSETTATDEQPPGPVVVRVVVEGGVPRGGIVRETVTKGDRVALVVRSDVADEVHLHGYDISRDVAAGGTARIAFRANIAGRFEVELEERSVQIADLTVRP